MIVFNVVVTPNVMDSNPLKTFNAVITKTVLVKVPAKAPNPTASGFLIFVFVVVCFYFCHTKKERGGEGAEPSNIPGTDSEA